MRTSQKHIIISIMNYWGKLATILFLSFAILSACEAPKEIGLPPGTVVDVKFIDTFSVKTSTVLLDSVRTTGAAQMLLGSYFDPQFGDVSAKSFFEYTGVINLSADKVYQYDSVALSMTYSYIYGDTLQPFTLNIHKLKDTLENKNYYNNSSVPYQTQPFITSTFRPSFASSTSLFIRLPDDYGRLMFGSYSAGLDTYSKFTNAFKGFAFIPDPSNKAIVGFPSSNIQIIVYFHEVNSTSQIAYPIRVTNRRFNHVESQNGGTILSKLKPLQPISSQQLGGNSYIQDALGIVTKIEFPTLSKLLQDKNIAFNRVELSIKPDLNIQTGGYYNLPSALVLAETDGSNKILRTKGDLELLLSNDNQVFSGNISPQIGLYSSKYQNYNFVLTNYLQALSVGFKKSDGLLLMPLDYNSWSSYVSATSQNPTKFSPYLNTKVNRLTIRPSSENLKLMVFYTTVK